jgi:RNA polymerase sigma-70 factor, ECF subfamily
MRLSLLGRQTAGRSDSELLNQFQRRRGEAEFRILYRRHAPRMREVSRRLVGSDGHAADDVTQEAWLRAVRAIASFEGRSSLRSWLIGFVVNVAREVRRRAGAGPVYMAEPPEQPPAPADPLATLALERAVDALPPGYRAVLLLHDLGGFTHAEIAELLEIEEGTSKSQLARARSAVRARLRPAPEEER